MHLHTALTFSWLNVLTKKRYDALIEQFGDLDTALSQLEYDLLANIGCRDETILTALNRLDEFDPAVHQTQYEQKGIKLVTIEDDLYPVALKHIADPPVFLYYKGSLDILHQPTIGCVGKREMSTYGKRVVERFVPAFCHAGMIPVSGLAMGVDAEVAKEAIYAKTPTVAVLGHGLGMMYPKSNTKLSEDIINAGGLILSEFPLDIQPGKHTFPARNRIIAALSIATVVLEAGKGSGACITADLALEYGKDVFAVPGQIFDENFEGCHELIAKGHAKLATDPSEILRDIGIVHTTTQKPVTEYAGDDPEEKKIYDVLTAMPQSVTDIVEKAAIETAIINAKLTMMELSGSAKNVGNGMWVRS